MGADISSIDEFESFQKNYFFQKQFVSENYGEIKSFKHPTTEHFIAIKTYLHQGVVDPKKLELSAAEQKSMKHESLAECTHVFCNNHEELCGRFIKVHLVYDFYQRNLSQEIERRKNEHEFFVENEVVSLLYTVISGLLYLKSLKKCHGDINPTHIMITKDGRFKISDVQFLTELDEYHRFFIGLGDHCYLSPILFQSLGHRSINPAHNSEKSCVFSLGMVIVHMGLLDFPKDVHNFDTFEINENGLKGRLNKKALGLYSERMQKLLWKMVEFDEEFRIDYEGILKELDQCKINASIILERELMENPKKYLDIHDMPTTNRMLRTSPAKTLERETLFDLEEDVMLNVPNNLNQIYEKMFKSEAKI
jgi:serine/threonine protein kinase